MMKWKSAKASRGSYLYLYLFLVELNSSQRQQWLNKIWLEEAKLKEISELKCLGTVLSKKERVEEDKGKSSEGWTNKRCTGVMKG